MSAAKNTSAAKNMSAAKNASAANMNQQPSDTPAARETYTQLSDRRQIMLRTSMYLGGKDVGTDTYYVLSGNKIAREKLSFSGAAFKCIDEVVVNAVDQYTRNGKTDIWITMHAGTITVRNNNGYIPVALTKTLEGDSMHVPQLIFGEYRTSSTYTSDNKHTGGINGYGVKLTNTFSEVFSIDNYDPVARVRYQQEWNKSKSIDKLYCDPPVITPVLAPLADDRAGYTQVSFRLDLHEFGMSDWTALEKLTHMRALHTSVFLGTGSRVFWNGVQLTMRALPDMADAFLASVSDDEEYTRVVFTAGAKNKWSVVLAVKPCTNVLYQTVSIINGILVSDGNHFVVLERQIIAYMEPRVLALYTRLGLKKKFTKTAITKYLAVFISGYIDNPEYKSQSKTCLDMSIDKFTEYRVPEHHLLVLWQALEPLLHNDTIPAAGKATRRVQIVKGKKYSPAKLAGGKDSKLCSLFIAEGDSALGLIDAAITADYSKQLTRMTHGSYSIQGVPVNARKQIKIVKKKDGTITKVPSTLLTNNERLSTLESILGLNKNRDFDTREEASRVLRYGHIIIASDADDDGRGNIRSLIINWMQTFWPKLVALGFVQFINTPIIRAFPSAHTVVLEFFTLAAFTAWNNAPHAKHDIKYYKGLAGHEADDAQSMFSSWPDILYTYFSDAKTENAMEVYFGLNADLRKQILVLPVTRDEDTYYVNNRLSITDHLNTSTRAYQQHNISRHIQSMIDGQTPSRRKIIESMRQVFAGTNTSMKVYQFAGLVAHQMHFANGDTSLQGSMVRMAQAYVGAREFPLLIGVGNFGTRDKGGDNHGAARYIDVRMNRQLVNALFPVLDACNLTYCYDEGTRCEPEFYVPVVPLSILESFSAPGSGWSSTIWARDYKFISKHLHACILAGSVVACEEFPVCDWRYTHTVQFIKGVPNSLGNYHISAPDTIVITELPMNIWNEAFVQGIDELEEVESVFDTSNASRIHIEIVFHRGRLADARVKGAEKISSAKQGLDPLIAYLDLKKSLSSNICMIGTSSGVVEYDSYTSVFRDWFAIRKHYYQLRVTRTTVVLELQIVLLENQTRFIAERDNYELRVPLAAQITLLAEHRYLTIDKYHLGVNDLIGTADLRTVLLEGAGATYGYLTRMSSEDISNESLKRLQDTLKQARADLHALQRQDTFPGARTWTSELVHLDQLVDKYRAAGTWTYDVRKPLRR